MKMLFVEYSLLKLLLYVIKLSYKEEYHQLLLQMHAFALINFALPADTLHRRSFTISYPDLFRSRSQSCAYFTRKPFVNWINSITMHYIQWDSVNLRTRTLSWIIAKDNNNFSSLTSVTKFEAFNIMGAFIFIHIFLERFI
jgi:hypothetical protein